MLTEEIKSIINSFRPPAFPGSYFISFEGIEGAGKTTQINKVKDYLENKGLRAIVLREPGGTIFGEKLRGAILNSNVPIHPLAEAHLFAASRAQLLEEVTLKELNTPNTVVIYDRYLDSTLAYQGKARKLGTKTVLEIHNAFPLNLVPHLTFYLKISPETSMARQKMRNAPKDYFESKGESFYKELVTGYEEARELFPNRIVPLNGDDNEGNVFQFIIEKINRLIES